MYSRTHDHHFFQSPGRTSPKAPEGVVDGKKERRGAKFRKLVEPGCIDSCGRFKPWASSWWIKLWSAWGLWSLPKWASENWGNFSTYFHPLTGMFPQKQLFSPCEVWESQDPNRAMPRPLWEQFNYSLRLEWRTRTIYNLSSCRCWQLIWHGISREVFYRVPSLFLCTTFSFFKPNL